MKYKVCDKCGEIVAKTGFVSSSISSQEGGHFAKCHNRECGCSFSRNKYDRLEEKEF
jgi:hypothetical protein